MIEGAHSELTPEQYEKAVAELCSKGFTFMRTPNALPRAALRKKARRVRTPALKEDRRLPVCVGLPATLIKAACAVPCDQTGAFKLEVFIERAMRNELERINPST